MAFPTKNTFTFDHTAEETYPTWTPEQAKINLNARGEELRLALNAVVDLLNATTAGASAAHNLGSAAITGVSGTVIWDQLVNIKGQIDAVVLGDIPDASITTDKLAFDVATQAELGAVIAAYQAEDITIRAADSTILHRMYMGV